MTLLLQCRHTLTDTESNMWIIVNTYGERMYQFGAFVSQANACDVLRKAIDKYPNAGLKVVYHEGVQ